MSNPKLSDVIMPRVTCYVGIDPGLEGGIAYVAGNDAECWQLPVIGREIDVAALRRLLLDLKPDIAVIERAQVRPGLSAQSSFTIGRNYGALLGVLSTLQIRIDEVAASSWKRTMGVTADKASSVCLASRLFPSVELVAQGRRKPSDGMAEALLLAEYGRRSRAI